MPKINHRRKNRAPVDRRYGDADYDNGYPRRAEDDDQQRVGKTGFLDKSMHGWGRTSTFADVHIGAGIGNDFADGHRGMAKAVRGAKKFVRSRIRFHEKAATRKVVEEVFAPEPAADPVVYEEISIVWDKDGKIVRMWRGRYDSADQAEAEAAEIGGVFQHVRYGAPE